jgi:hypothetical protein
MHGDHGVGRRGFQIRRLQQAARGGGLRWRRPVSGGADNQLKRAGKAWNLQASLPVGVPIFKRPQNRIVLYHGRIPLSRPML